MPKVKTAEVNVLVISMKGVSLRFDNFLTATYPRAADIRGWDISKRKCTKLKKRKITSSDDAITPKVKGLGWHT